MGVDRGRVISVQSQTQGSEAGQFQRETAEPQGGIGGRQAQGNHVAVGGPAELFVSRHGQQAVFDVNAVVRLVEVRDGIAQPPRHKPGRGLEAVDTVVGGQTDQIEIVVAGGGVVDRSPPKV